MSLVTDALKPYVSVRARRRILELRTALRSPTSRLRILPDFLVIGAQRAGTSSLYKYLGRHPCVAPSLRKEVQYLSARHGRGVDWYRIHFPLAARRRLWEGVLGRPLLSFEATPDYLFHPLTPRRAADLLPEARLIVLLRDPVDRAYSHYRHNVRLGFEDLSFEAALAAEPHRLAGEMERLMADPTYPAKSLLRYSYFARGRYAEQLERWYEAYPPERLHVISSEDFYRRTPEVFREVLAFLELPEWSPGGFRNYSYLKTPPPQQGPDPEVRLRLQQLYSSDTRRLRDLLGRELSWMAR